MERVLREYTDVTEAQPPTSYRAPLNRVAGPRSWRHPPRKDMPIANHDSLYMSAVLEGSTWTWTS